MVQIWLKTSPVEVKSAGSSWYKKAGIAAELLCAVDRSLWYIVVWCGIGMVVCGTLWFGVVLVWWCMLHCGLVWFGMVW